MMLKLQKRLPVAFLCALFITSCADQTLDRDLPIETTGLTACTIVNGEKNEKALLAKSSVPSLIKDNLDWSKAKRFCESNVGTKTLVQTKSKAWSGKYHYILFVKKYNPSKFSLHVFSREHQGSLLKYTLPNWGTNKFKTGVFDYSKSGNAKWVDFEARKFTTLVYKESGLSGMSTPRDVTVQACAASISFTQGCGGPKRPPSPPPPPQNCDNCDRKYTDMKTAELRLESAEREFASATRAIGPAERAIDSSRLVLGAAIGALAACKGASYSTLGLAEIACASAAVAVESASTAVTNAITDLEDVEHRVITARGNLASKNTIYENAERAYRNCNPC